MGPIQEVAPMSQLAKFENLLRRAAVLGAEVRVVPMINRYYGDVEFYAHIDGHDGDNVDMTIDGGPGLKMVELSRSADGLHGADAEPVSKKAESFTRQSLDP
jgi:hypothetical protein